VTSFEVLSRRLLEKPEIKLFGPTYW